MLLDSQTFEQANLHLLQCPLSSTARQSRLRTQHAVLNFRLFRVDTKEFKETLTDAYAALSTAILTALRTRTRYSNDRLIEQYVAAEVEVNKGALTSDEVLALKRLIQAQQAQQEVMKDEIKENKATVDFLVEYSMHIPNEVRL